MTAQWDASPAVGGNGRHTGARLVWLAVGLSLGAAIALGVARFAYGLLLPPMRADLGWSYALAGAMNTANAAGYLLGALVAPWLIRRAGSERVLIGGAVAASLALACSGAFISTLALLVWRVLAGVASAWVFVTGGLLAARLAERQPERGGLLIGLYYGGTGFGIMLSAVLVPAVLGAFADRPHAWIWAWWGLALLCALATLGLLATTRAWHATDPSAMARPLRVPRSPSVTSVASASRASAASAVPRTPIAMFRWAIAGYACFGAGYIGYMTFVIALLRDQGADGPRLTLFYALLGLTCVLSSRLWAGVLDRWRGGQPQALLNGLLGAATILPVLSDAWWLALVSGALFGAAFLSVVASTTAFVRHNLPASQWAAGISAFTIVFAFGQILGPIVVGWLSDGAGGLSRGLVASALMLWVGALLALRQRPLPTSRVEDRPV